MSKGQTQARVHVMCRGSTCKGQYCRYVYTYTYTDTCRYAYTCTRVHPSTLSAFEVQGTHPKYLKCTWK